MENLRDVILEYLARNKLMTLATCSAGSTPWASTVFFAYDENLQLYFLSERTTRHGRNIAKNPRVAAAINQDFGTPGLVKGLQLEGCACEIEPDELPRTLALFRKRYRWLDRLLADPALVAKGETEQRLYCIVPSKIYIIDDKRFGKLVRKEYTPKQHA